jgi:hypothetical protein
LGCCQTFLFYFSSHLFCFLHFKNWFPSREYSPGRKSETELNSVWTRVQI